jgi:hypothetical protein
MTYCRDEDLEMDTGRSVNALFDASLSDSDIKKVKEKARIRAYNKINDHYLRGKTAVPAVHIPGLLEIEKDLALASLLRGAYTMEGPNISEWAKNYEDNAIEALKVLRFGASAEDVVPSTHNTGNGYVSEIIVSDRITLTEDWVLKAMDSDDFTVYGSISGYLLDAEVGEPYPDKDWSHHVEDYNFKKFYNADDNPDLYPIQFTITQGSTAFAKNDSFVFRTYQASFYKKTSGFLERG